MPSGETKRGEASLRRRRPGKQAAQCFVHVSALSDDVQPTIAGGLACGRRDGCSQLAVFERGVPRHCGRVGLLCLVAAVEREQDTCTKEQRLGLATSSSNASASWPAIPGSRLQWAQA